MIDLHAHTTASDGLLSPEALVEAALAAGLTVLGVTDHDTIDGVEPATSAAAGRLRIVPGIELSSAGHRHVLGLFVDPQSPSLRRFLSRLQDERFDRGRRMVERLNELGYQLTFEQVLAQSEGRVVARPHVARALVATGQLPDVSSAFTQDLIANGGLADVPRVLPSPVEAVRMIREAGGAAVLAHPSIVRGADGTQPIVPEELIGELAGAGMAGLEVDHPNQPPEVRDALRATAVRFGLICTGGSDFHGTPGSTLGTCRTLARAFEDLEARAG